MRLKKSFGLLFFIQIWGFVFLNSTGFSQQTGVSNYDPSNPKFLGEFIAHNGGFYTIDPKLVFLKWPGPLYISGCLGSAWGEEHGRAIRTVLVKTGKQSAILEIGTIDGPFDDFGLGEGSFWVANILGYWEPGQDYFGDNLTLTNGGAGTAANIGPIAEFLSKQNFTLLNKRNLDEVLEITSSRNCPPPHYFFRWLALFIKKRDDWEISSTYNNSFFGPGNDKNTDISIIGFFENGKGPGELKEGIYETLFTRNYLFEINDREKINNFLKLVRNSSIEKGVSPHCKRNSQTKEIHTINLDLQNIRAGYFILNFCKQGENVIADFYTQGGFVGSSAEVPLFLSKLGFNPKNFE